MEIHGSELQQHRELQQYHDVLNAKRDEVLAKLARLEEREEGKGARKLVFDLPPVSSELGIRRRFPQRILGQFQSQPFSAA